MRTRFSSHRRRRPLEADDLLHAVEIRMRASKGELLSVELLASEELDDAATIGVASSS